ncbi:MAG: VOC family protein [bacterium]|nr:VOC family protein [bacterium]
MLARGLGHVSFPVADLERSLHFYRDVLGLAEIPRPDLGFPGAWLGVGDGQVHLIQRFPGVDVGTAPPALNPTAQHVAFLVDDYATTLARLGDAGLAVLSTSPEAGQMWVQDPDGHVIELTAAPR